MMVEKQQKLLEISMQFHIRMYILALGLVIKESDIQKRQKL